MRRTTGGGPGHALIAGEPAWFERQIAALRSGDWNDLDVEGLAEELEALSRQERRILESNLTVLLIHLLKLGYQPIHATPSWTNSVSEHARRIARDLDEAPSLVSFWSTALGDAYASARGRAAVETNLTVDTFPEQLEPQLYRKLREEIADAAFRLRNRRRRDVILPPDTNDT